MSSAVKPISAYFGAYSLNTSSRSPLRFAPFCAPHGDQVISLLRRNAEFVHQGGCRAAALGKVHAERVAQQIAAFGGLAQFVAIRPVFVRVVASASLTSEMLSPEIVAVHLLRDAAQFFEFLPRRARLRGQLVRRLLIVRAQLHDLFCARQRRSGQRCDGSSGSFQPGLHRAARDVAGRAHGVGHAVGGAVGLLGSRRPAPPCFGRFP